MYLVVKKLELKFFSIKFLSVVILSKLNEYSVFSSLNVLYYLILIVIYIFRVDGCSLFVLYNFGMSLVWFVLIYLIFYLGIIKL